eukprot:Em0014g816a
MAANEAAGADLLVSNEKLTSDSPVMWPDHNFFGDFNPLLLSPAPPKWLLEVQKEDNQMMNEFGSLTHSQLMDKVRALENLAYQLGVEEAKQMSRGRVLSIFDVPDHQPGTSSRHTKHSRHS